MGGSCTRHPLCCRPFSPAPCSPPHRISETRGPKSVERPSNRQDEDALWVQLSPGGTAVSLKGGGWRAV